MATTQNKILKWNVNIYLLDWVSRWTFLLPTVQASSIGIRRVPKLEGMYALCQSLWSTLLWVHLHGLAWIHHTWQGWHWVKGFVLVLSRALFHYIITISYFNLHNWNFSLWGALPAMAMWVTSVRVILLSIPVSGEVHRPSVRLITSTTTLFLHLWTPFQMKCIK